MSEPIEPSVLDPAPAAHYPPPPLPLDPPEHAAAAFRAPVAHPLLGPSFWVFGTVTWAYVVVGELVVSLGLPELLGLVLVLSSTGYAWVLASGLADGEPFAVKRLLSLGFGLALFSTLLAVTVTVLGSHRQSQVAAVTVMLWFVSVFALLLGRRWTRRARPPRSSGDRLRSAAIWTLSVIATLIAMISAMDRM